MRLNLFCLLSFVFLFLVGCANSVPALSTADGFVVCDFFDEVSAPQIRLSFFAAAESDVRRVDSLRISSRKNGYEWQIPAPVLFEGNGRNWAGHTNLVYPAGEKIPSGVYDIYYTDAAGERVKILFTLNYDEKIYSAKAAAFPEIFETDFSEKLAIFSAENVLLYYGEKKEDWQSAKEIFAEFPDGDSFRLCYVSSQKKIIALMPPTYRNNAENYDDYIEENRTEQNAANVE